MPDDAMLRRPRASSRIALREDYEVRYWTDTIGVDEATLRGAVQAVGVSAADVRDYIAIRKAHAHR